MEQFEIKLEKEHSAKLKTERIKDDRWAEFWRIVELAKCGKSFFIDTLPLTIIINHNKYHFDDIIVVGDYGKLVWTGFDKEGKLMVFTLATDKTINLIFNNKALHGKVEDINEKDDPQIPELLILTCVAGDVRFKVNI